MAVAPRMPKFVGERVRRREDPRLITGHSTYVDDVQLPGALYMAILRSPHANARIVSIDDSAARRAPGVVDVVTGATIQQFASQVPGGPLAPDQKAPQHWPVAVGFARFVGDPVAAVVAETREAAEDALGLINVDYEPRPAVIDLEKAAEKGSPRVYEEFEDNVEYDAPSSSGDVEGAFRAADRVVSARIVNQRVVPLPMEPRCVAAEF